MDLSDFLNVKMFQLIVLINIVTNYYTFAIIDDDIQGLKGVQDFSEPKNSDDGFQIFKGKKDFSEPNDSDDGFQTFKEMKDFSEHKNSGESKEFMGIPGFSQAISQYLLSMTLERNEDLQRVGFDEEQNNNNLIKILLGGLTKDQISSHVIDYDGGEIHITNNEITTNSGVRKEQTFDLVFPSKKTVHTLIKKDENENTLQKFFDLSSKIGSNLSSDQSKNKPVSSVQTSDLSQADNKYSYRKKRFSSLNHERAHDRRKRGFLGGTFQTLGSMFNQGLSIPEQFSTELLGGQPAGGMAAAGGAANGGAAGK